MNTKTKEIIEGLQNVRDAIMFLTAPEAQEIIEEHNSKSPNKLKLETNSDGSFTLTEQSTGINISIQKMEIQG